MAHVGEERLLDALGPPRRAGGIEEILADRTLRDCYGASEARHLGSIRKAAVVLTVHNDDGASRLVGLRKCIDDVLEADVDEQHLRAAIFDDVQSLVDLQMRADRRIIEPDLPRSVSNFEIGRIVVEQNCNAITLRQAVRSQNLRDLVRVAIELRIGQATPGRIDQAVLLCWM